MELIVSGSLGGSRPNSGSGSNEEDTTEEAPSEQDNLRKVVSVAQDVKDQFDKLPKKPDVEPKIATNAPSITNG